MNAPERDMRDKKIITIANHLSLQTESILAPIQLIEQCHRLSLSCLRIDEIEIGKTEKGCPILAYEYGSGPFHILMYGFPDPGEAIGGTTILTLLAGLSRKDPYLLSLNATWHFIPCLNFDDQPHHGKRLSPVFRDKKIREVDWCMDHPRSETTALVQYAQSIEPGFTYALHDEFHSGLSSPSYMGLSAPIEKSGCESIRSCLRYFGLKVDKTYFHEGMGEGFFLMERCGDEYLGSTFYHFSKYGLVGICEISQRKEVAHQSLIAAQIAVGFLLIEEKKIMGVKAGG